MPAKTFEINTRERPAPVSSNATSKKGLKLKFHSPSGVKPPSTSRTRLSRHARICTDLPCASLNERRYLRYKNTMGFAVWIDQASGVVWAQGTHEYRPMGAAVIAVTDQFRGPRLRPVAPLPGPAAPLVRGVFRIARGSERKPAFAPPLAAPLDSFSLVVGPSMGRMGAIAGSAVFLVLAPGLVAGWIPWWISDWRLQAPFFGLPFVRVGGGILIALGAVGLLDSFARFAWQGVGTPAPVLPTRNLVVTGLYRSVRNPIYVSVVSAILGQALLFGNAMLLAYGGLVWLLFHIFVLAYEEPTLRNKFGSEYEAFCGEVPRWIPRLSPWTAPPEATRL